MIVCMMMENVTRIKSEVTISEGESAKIQKNLMRAKIFWLMTFHTKV